MLPSENELDNLLATPMLKPPADFANTILQKIENIPMHVLQTVSNQRTKTTKQLKVVLLNLTKVAAFVLGIMLATAAV
jgi:hypothetical protein